MKMYCVSDKMVNKKEVLILFAFVFAVFVSLNFVSAAVEVTLPTNSSNHTGTAVFNVTYANNTDIVDPVNATFFYNLSGTWTAIGNTTPTVGCNFNSSSCTVTLDISSLTDGVYSINATIYNGTSSVSAGTATYEVLLDSTGPQVSPSNISYPSSGGNFSEVNGLIYFNVTIIDLTSTVDGVWINITNATAPIQNQTVVLAREGTTDYFSGSINSSSLFEDKYNITLYSNDTLGNANNSAFLTAITIDNTIPVISSANITAISAGHNYSTAGLKNSLYINVSFFDALSGVGQVIFNITNGTGVQNGTLTATLSGTVFYATLNTSHFPDGNYTVTALVNDSAGNQNNSASIGTFTLDNSVPAISFSCTPSTVDTGDTVTCSCSASDLSGVNRTTFTTNPSTIDTGSKNTECTISDLAGNSATSSTSYTVNQGGSVSGGGGGGGGGGGTSSSWTTYSVNDKALEDGHSRSLSSNQRLRINVKSSSGVEEHFVGIKAVSTVGATIEVSSTPQTVTMRVGETNKFDVNNDSYYDISVTLESVNKNNAKINVKTIKELIVNQPRLQPEVDEEDQEDVGYIEPIIPDSPDSYNKGNSTIWKLLVVILILLGVIVWWVAKKKKR
jgi:uncharacterized membrane protein YgcG